MTLITLKCKNCGSGMTIDPNSKTATCKHCGSTFMMAELLDEKDMSFSKSISPEDIQQKIEFAETLKQGETYLYQAEYKLAEECFKRAIQLCNTNYKGYFGVVKAKTSNFNQIPDDDSYKDFARYALKTVTVDDYAFVKNELAKLAFLEKEQEQHLKQIINLKEKERQHKKVMNDNEKFFGKIALSVVFIITIFILTAIFVSNQQSKTWKIYKNTYIISSVEDIITYSSNNDFYKSKIILNNNIDLSNSSWTPIGTKNQPFTGEFNGNGYTISNFNILVENQNTSNYIGLFGYINNANIKNVKLDNVSITDNQSYLQNTTNFIGLICGFAENSTISYCEILNTNNININYSNNVSIRLGGIVGGAVDTIINHSYSNSSITSIAQNIEIFNETEVKLYVGGVTGSINNCKVNHCFSLSNINTDYNSTSNVSIISYTGGVIGYNNALTSNNITACYFAGNIDVSSNSPSYRTFVSGVIAYGANYDKMSSNFSLLNNNFSVNNNAIELPYFKDNSPHTNTVTYHLMPELILKIKNNYRSSIWNVANCPNLTLKF